MSVKRLSSTAAPAAPEPEMTITDSLQAIYEYVAKEDDFVLADKDEDNVKPRPDAAYAHLRQVLDITDRQIEILSVILELSLNGGAHSKSIADRLGITHIKFLSIRADLEALAAKRYIIYNKKNVHYSSFIVPGSFTKAISENRCFNPTDLEQRTVPKFCRQLDALFREYHHGNIDTDTLAIEIELVYQCSAECPLVDAYNAYNLSELDHYERMLFSYMLARNVCHNENSFIWEDYSSFYAESDLISEIFDSIVEGDMDIFKKGLVEHDNSGGFQNSECIRLTDKARKEFIGQTHITTKVRDTSQAFRIIPHDEITPKQLFFNDRERSELDRLSGLLQKENFDNVIARLQEKGMRQGVACLFYGAPGTGKTASCYNLSAATGRDIYFVDMAQLKSKWVGESEQNLSNLFKAYHKAVKESPLAPVMVWNEADAIFGRRRKVEHAVDKMENAMQNIILQELEDLEGILIATTNFSLKDGFDPAMERRFLIKVCFNKPEVNTRTKIWRSMFTELVETDARTLATEYDFSGGLIENINRRATVDYVLSGRQLSLDYLRDLCRSEQMESTTARHIGFS